MFDILEAQANGDLLDQLLALAILLFVMSVITEKFVSLIRKYIPHLRSWFAVKKIYGTYVMPAYERSVTRHFVQETYDPAKHDDWFKEREVMVLSIVIGFAIAWMSKANFFDLLVALGATGLATGEETWSLVKVFRFIIGLFLTGFFLSFGSKFFHDLIDTLLQVKNLRRKMNDEKLFQVESIKQFDEYLRVGESDVIRLAINQHNEALMKNANVTSIAIGTSTKSGRKVKSLHVHLTGKSDGTIPSELPVTMPSGATTTVPVEIMESVGRAKIAIGPGTEIANETKREFRGSFGCVLKRGAEPHRFVLTCSHVLTGGTSEDRMGRIPTTERDEVVQFQTGATLGDWFYGVRNDLFDVALVLTQDGDLNNVIDGTPIVKARDVTTADINNEIAVRLHGAKTGSLKEGILLNREAVAELDYADRTVTMHDLIVVGRRSNSKFESLSQRGDSGSVVIDAQGNALGLIVAGSSSFSYAIPMTSILKLLSMQIAS